MARKNLLDGLMTAPATPATHTGAAPETKNAELPAGNSRPHAPASAPTSGAIGAVGRSVADLKARAVVEVDPRMIDGAGLRDRLDPDDDLDQLAASIREHGQQVPVLLRVNPTDRGRYEVVYGRRRVAALQRIGRRVRALIRDLDDRALVIAQGQENAHRKDLSFIERANFARQMRDGGYARAAICEALAVDKTGVSKLLAVADRIPEAVIGAIGAAPSFGRDRWLALADSMGVAEEGAIVAAAIGGTSDDRFAAVTVFLAKPKRPRAPVKVIPGPDGPIARVRMEAGRAQVTVEDARFGEWLAAHLPRLHDEWFHATET